MITSSKAVNRELADIRQMTSPKGKVDYSALIALAWFIAIASFAFYITH